MDSPFLSGFSMCRNADKLYYPIEESVRSALEVVDEFVIAVGRGDEDDETRSILSSIDSPKLKIIDTEWNLEAYPRGMVHAQQTDFAKSHCTGKWLLYLQADEVLHEDDAQQVRNGCLREDSNEAVEGFIFDYLHFWGDYDHVLKAHGWYKKEIRVIRNREDIHSWESAQSFRVIPDFDGVSYRDKEGTRKLNVKDSGARIFHYGGVRPPRLMTEKMNQLDQIHSHSRRRYTGDFDFGSPKAVSTFLGGHPKWMDQRRGRLDWNPWNKDGKTDRPKYKHERLKNRILTAVEEGLFDGRQLFSFKNYKQIG